MSTTGHESEAIKVSGLKAALKKGGNKGLFNEATCSTAGGTAAKVTNTVPPSFSLTAGAKIIVKFTYAISAENATLQVGETAAKPIYYRGAALPAGIVKAGDRLLLSYNGTQWDVISHLVVADESLQAVSSGTALSLVTTGEKFQWNSKTSPTINTTYAALKSLRDNSQLVAGQWYRITDFVTTVDLAECQSAGHAFDVIVLATEPNNISSTAFAALHSGDTYFANSDLEKWELRYSLDNDKTMYDWADTTNGKGVIYYMKDEHNNETRYDFKNFQRKLYKVADSHPTRTGLNGKYFGLKGHLPDDGYWDIVNGAWSLMPATLTIPDETDFIWAYTFSSSSAGGEQTDTSLSSSTYDNIIIGEKGRTCSIIMYGHAFSNTMKSLTSYIVLGDRARKNTIDPNSFNIVVGPNSDSLQLGKYMESITFGSGAVSSFINQRMAFCSFGDSVARLNINCSTFQRTCFENNVQFIDINGFVTRSYIASNCRYISFDGEVRYIKIDKEYSYNIYVKGSKYVTLTSNQTTSASAMLQNITIAPSTNLDTPIKTISHDTVNDTAETIYQSPDTQIVSI